MLNVIAGVAGSALLEHAERAMLDLDDEMAALIAAAAVPADQAGTHSSGPEAVPGESHIVHSMCCAFGSALPICSMVPSSSLCSTSVDKPLQCCP